MRGTGAHVVADSQVIVNDEPVALTLRAVVPAKISEKTGNRTRKVQGRGVDNRGA